MGTAIIHVGMDKTGTTYLQEGLSLQRDELARLGLFYPTPKQPGETHHVAFASAHGFSWNVEATTEGSRDAWSQMQEPLPPATTTTTLLLSTEHFCYNATSQTVNRLHDWLTRNGFDEVRIIIFLRNQVSWLISAYGEMIKWGGKDELDEYYCGIAQRLVYSTLVDVWAAAFGADRVRLVNYDQACQKDPEQGIVDAFWDAVGVPVVRHALPKMTESVFGNRLSSQVLLEWLRTCQVPLQPAQFQAYAAQVLSTVKVQTSQPLIDTKIWPLPSVLERDFVTYAHDNAVLSQRFDMPPLADLSTIAAAYDRSVVPMSRHNVHQAASMILFEASRML